MSPIQWLQWAAKNPQGIVGDVRYTLRAMRYRRNRRRTA